MRPLIGSIPGWVAVASLLLLGFAFVGGAIWTLRGSAGSGMAAQNSIPKIMLLDLAFQSSPMGADVYIVGSNEYLGRTPFRRKVEYRDDRFYPDHQSLLPAYDRGEIDSVSWIWP